MPCGDAHVHNPREKAGKRPIGKAEQTAAVPAWVPWMGVLCRRSGQTQWMRGGCTGCAGCVSQWLLCRGEGVTCNGHEAERSAQADRGARGGRAVEGGCSLSRCAGAWPWWVFGRLVVGGPLGRSPLTLGGCAIGGGPLVQALGDFWRPFGVGFVDWASPARVWLESDGENAKSRSWPIADVREPLEWRGCLKCLTDNSGRAEFAGMRCNLGIAVVSRRNRKSRRFFRSAGCKGECTTRQLRRAALSCVELCWTDAKHRKAIAHLTAGPGRWRSREKRVRIPSLASGRRGLGGGLAER